MAFVHIGLGTNLGDRVANLRAALGALCALGRLEAISSVWETAPVGVVDQPAFLNMAAALETTLAPLDLLAALKEAEERLGRVASRRWGPRLIDLDVLLWGGESMESERLTLPHPRLHERRFALAPLAEIAPEAVHPSLDRTVAALLAELPAEDGEVKNLGPLAEIALIIPCTTTTS